MNICWWQRIKCYVYMAMGSCTFLKTIYVYLDMDVIGSPQNCVEWCGRKRIFNNNHVRWFNGLLELFSLPSLRLWLCSALAPNVLSIYFNVKTLYGHFGRRLNGATKLLLLFQFKTNLKFTSVFFFFCFAVECVENHIEWQRKKLQSMSTWKTGRVRSHRIGIAHTNEIRTTYTDCEKKYINFHFIENVITFKYFTGK